MKQSYLVVMTVENGENNNPKIVKTKKKEEEFFHRKVQCVKIKNLDLL